MSSDCPLLWISVGDKIGFLYTLKKLMYGYIMVLYITHLYGIYGFIWSVYNIYVTYMSLFFIEIE